MKKLRCLAATCLMLCLFVLKPDAQDTSHINLRTFNAGALDKLKAEKEFVYEPVQSANPGLWSLIKSYWNELIARVFSDSQQGTIIKIIVYLLMIGAVVAVVLNLLGIDLRRILVGAPGQIIQYKVEEENLREMDIDDYISKARAEGQWRLCIRYQYLKALRMLSDKEMIKWEQGKTNMDYYYEMKGATLKQIFLDITGAFENVWYGHHELSAEDYALASSGYEKFYSFINEYKRQG